MNILIIGSKGFIGSHALLFFKNLKHTVFGSDIVVDYEAENYFLLSVVNANFQEIFSAQNFDVCLNCSGAASVPDSLLHPQRDFELNVSNVFKILDAIRISQPSCKFINLSSAAVYGNPEKLPITENILLQPVSPYGLHKKMAEEILTEFHQHYNIPTISLRIFSVFGPNLKKQLFWDLYKKMSHDNEQIEIFGTGNESRDFIFITDLLNAIYLIIKHSTFEGNVMNVANGKEILIKDAVDKFTQEFQWKGKIVYSQSNRTGDPVNWQADISNLKRIGYEQKFSLQAGLKEYVQWLKEKK